MDEVARPFSGSVLSEEADAAYRQCMRVAAQLEQSQHDLITASMTPSRLTATVDCVSICENFIHSRVREIADRHVENVNDPMLLVLYRQSKPIDSSWQSVRDTGRSYLKFDLYAISEWATFAGLIEVRNAALHGAGSLTRQQLKKEEEVIRKISAAGFGIHSREVVPGDATPLDVAKRCGAMILAVDELTWSTGLGLAAFSP